MKNASDFYFNVAKQYEQTVFKKIQKELISEILQNLFSCFDNKLKMLRRNTFQKIEEEVKKLERKELDEICDVLSEILTNL